MIRIKHYCRSAGNFLPALMALIALCLSPRASAQGFDWQYSSRLPSTYPRLFLGGNISGIYAFHTADIYALGEEYRCGDYKKGTETGLAVSVAGEYWQTGSMAFWGMVGFRTSAVRFTAQTQPEPFRLNGEEFALRREFAMDAHLQSIAGELGVKYRLGKTHFHTGAGLRAELALKTTAEQTETILTPVQFTQSILYGQTTLNGMRSFLLTPFITAGYDAEIGKGIYATPRLVLGLPLMSRASSVDWNTIDISGGVSFFVSF
ncbi:MAG: hypothetical protein U0264_16510 [Candidatus Kapaibacterium sp.]